MKTGTFTRTTLIATIMLAACLTIKPAMASLKNPVTRPVKVIEGHLTITIDPVTGDYQFTDWGMATHVGLVTNSGAGVLNLATGQFVSGTGVIVTANGDLITWAVGTVPNTVLYTGGTGRFEGASGGITISVTSQTLLSVNEDGTVTFLMTYVADGSITY
jgi:hypothetical protein